MQHLQLIPIPKIDLGFRDAEAPICTPLVQRNFIRDHNSAGTLAVLGFKSGMSDVFSSGFTPNIEPALLVGLATGGGCINFEVGSLGSMGSVPALNRRCFFAKR